MRLAMAVALDLSAVTPFQHQDPALIKKFDYPDRAVLKDEFPAEQTCAVHATGVCHSLTTGLAAGSADSAFSLAGARGVADGCGLAPASAVGVFSAGALGGADVGTGAVGGGFAGMGLVVGSACGLARCSGALAGRGALGGDALAGVPLGSVRFSVAGWGAVAVAVGATGGCGATGRAGAGVAAAGEVGAAALGAGVGIAELLAGTWTVTSSGRAEASRGSARSTASELAGPPRCGLIGADSPGCESLGESLCSARRPLPERPPFLP